MNTIKCLFIATSLIAGASSFAQDNLVNSLKINASEKSKEAFKFTDVVNVENTSIKNQGSSGTCWSYSANSFLESEMIKMGKKPIELSQIFSARNAYVEKGRNYVRMHGAVTLGDGGAFHDVMNMYRKYGAVPQSVYTGLNYGTDKNKFGEMAALGEALLAAVVKNPNGELTPNWEKAYTAVIDSYLGETPKSFDYNGKKYTPETFAKEVVGINAEDYIEISSLQEYPYYSKFVLMVPDNWAFDQVYNVKINELTDVIDNALKSGYSVAWGGDVSEKTFSWKNGVAFVPEKKIDDMTPEEKADLFNGPKKEAVVTEEMRQKAFDNYTTTDDHGMHIVGLSKDQNGKEYYIVKNSWGTTNDYKGYLYMTKEFVKYKTTDIMLNKKALSADMAKKLKI
ncbi:aminopeptidase [Flavobacterium psychrophilum]|jgi:bleomycin hydrolase|uniref:Aminopeptidase n=2 Tax=Flavobacterium psychrophilum TaxID=96345 RepID=A6H250_FLAPJ|nr:C1 family peptidase [Flavobacterium psychrophilum]AIG31094.1 aminopeptidase [Flavobacterium psychrophilum]AIG33371.1 aminopeptidase [Flavobacterium psychrophilum]AIG35521.1 aminopeptidase [Flavobacterium psychrophilum]AIG37882.1 aminopeptidase [Flavobacterium psychrophilum]AIG40153.1 aminopeptidase [Flavobacterium psychrophilum]